MAAAPDAFPTKTTTVKVDGVPITGSNLENTVVFDGDKYYLWYKKTASLDVVSQHVVPIKSKASGGRQVVGG